MNLNVNNSLCNQCRKSLPENHVKCFQCKAGYHFNPCTTVSENTYASMNAERRADWKCQVCRQRNKSPNNICQEITFNETTNQQKQLRDEENEDSEGNNNKRFKDSISLNAVESKLSSVQSELKALNTTIEQLSTSISTSNRETNNTLSQIAATLATLTAQVVELNEKDKQKEKRIDEMDTRINKLEQRFLEKNIEVNNIQNKELCATDVIKKIASTVNVVINNSDISNAYRTRREEKIVVEFCSLSKKRELMSKIIKHRIESSVINVSSTANNHTYVFVNDQLSAYYRKLLWLAKTKAKETNWKFVWVKNGTIFARKKEGSRAIIISNATDIESINQTTQ